MPMQSNKHRCSSVYFTRIFVDFQLGILPRIKAGIPGMCSLYFIVHTASICYCRSQMHELQHGLKGFVNCLHVVLLSCIVLRHEYVSVFSVSTSRSTSLLSTDKSSVFSFIAFIFTLNKLTNSVRSETDMSHSVSAALCLLVNSQMQILKRF